MTDIQVHSCSYYCHRPECIKAQRDEFRDGLEGDKDGERYRSLVANWRARTKSHDKLGKATNNYGTRDRHTSCANVYETCADELDAAMKESVA